MVQTAQTAQSGLPDMHVVVRSIHAKKGRSGFSGPDKQVHLVVIPAGVDWPLSRPLAVASLHKYGVDCYVLGQGYWNHDGPKSMFGQALTRAESLRRELYAELRGGSGDPGKCEGEVE